MSKSVKNKKKSTGKIPVEGIEKMFGKQIPYHPLSKETKKAVAELYEKIHEGKHSYKVEFPTKLSEKVDLSSRIIFLTALILDNFKITEDNNAYDKNLFEAYGNLDREQRIQERDKLEAKLFQLI